jgi:hypothetical protein
MQRLIDRLDPRQIVLWPALHKGAHGIVLQIGR